MENLCDEWSDGERMRVMFAPLPDQHLNPESRNAKILFWTSLIKKWCVANNKCTFTLKQLESEFQRDGTSPHCLAQVLTEARSSGKIADSNRYCYNLTCQSSWGAWVKNIGWRAVQVRSTDYFYYYTF